MWWVKIIVVLLLIAAIVSLGSALFGLVKGDRPRLTMRALAWRVSFSVALLLFLVVSKLMGWLEPHDVNPHMRAGQPIEQINADDDKVLTPRARDTRPQRRPIDEIEY